MWVWSSLANVLGISYGLNRGIVEVVVYVGFGVTGAEDGFETKYSPIACKYLFCIIFLIALPLTASLLAIFLKGAATIELST